MKQIYKSWLLSIVLTTIVLLIVKDRSLTIVLSMLCGIVSYLIFPYKINRN